MTRDLDRLAEAVGIQRDYRDVWGQVHIVSDATKRALLRALGHPADDEAQVAESLHEIDARRWRRPLPPVGVYGEGEPLAVTIALPAVDSHLHWRIDLDDGRTCGGEIASERLELVETRKLGGSTYERRRLVLPEQLPTGYHRLTLDGFPDGVATMRLVVAPRRCFTVADAVADRARLWGIAVQIYGLRSDRNWGIGDFGDLANTARRAAALGADLIGINPVHALFAADPLHFGPYSPSNRAFLHFAYIDVEALPELAYCPEARARIAESSFQERLRSARAAKFVDYRAVSELKLPVLELLFRCFQSEAQPGGPLAERRTAFEDYRREIGSSLERHAVFEVLHEHFFANGTGPWSWRAWPVPYRHADSPEVARFAAQHAHRVEFFVWLQWIADSQLAEAHRAGCTAGMRLGLYRDLAVGVHPDGSAAWMQPEIVPGGVSIGAPPDPLGPEGQNWGVAPLSPEGIREAQYEPFIAALRANMRHAGALRIDHVMALERLFLIPEGMSGVDGAYVSYPLADLLRIVALESQRQRCIVIGEDLGTVPEGFRSALEEAGVLSYRILSFERDEQGQFKPPEAYPRQALAAPSTHDLPSLAGFWTGRDLEWRESLSSGSSGSTRSADARRERDQDRQRLLQVLRLAGYDPGGTPASAALPPNLRAAVYRFLAATPAYLLMVPIEDMVGEIEQPNLPGTTDGHPNWQRKLSRTIASIFDDSEVQELARMISAVRGNSGAMQERR